jgi:hypothetical protein
LSTRFGRLLTAEDGTLVRFFELLQALVNGKVDFIVVGGVAAELEGAPVSTIDLAVVYEIHGSPRQPWRLECMP